MRKRKVAESKTTKAERDFETWWADYPNKTSKAVALKAWKSIPVSQRPDPENVRSFIARAKLTKRWREGFVKDGGTFVRHRSWEDDLAAYDGNGRAREDNRSREERRLAEQNEAIRNAGNGAAPIDVRARLDRLAAMIPNELHSYAEAIRSLDGDAAEVEAALERTNGLLLLDLPNLLSAERLAQLQADLDAAVLKLRRRLDGDQLERASAEMWERILREAAGVPEMSLFAPEVSE